jgi:2-polyprenyl-6-methoxyphenol hydroxylase-like FAD-dependent oxidoreductase
VIVVGAGATGLVLASELAMARADVALVEREAVPSGQSRGWKLAAAVAGRSPEALLDTYHDERPPVAARVLATVRAQRAIMSPPPEALDLQALREIMTDLPASRTPTGTWPG